MSDTTKQLFDDGESFLSSLPAEIQAKAREAGKEAGLPLDRLKASLCYLRDTHPSYFNSRTQASSLIKRLDQPALLTPVQALVQAEAIKQINAIGQEEIDWDNLPASSAD